MQLKIQSDLAAQRAKSAGIKTVMDRFPVIEITRRIRSGLLTSFVNEDRQSYHKDDPYFLNQMPSKLLILDKC
jgi:hypothetical protein